MIVSNKFLRANYGRSLRKFLRSNATVERVVDFAGLPVFQGATVRTIILLTRRPRRDRYEVLYSPPVSTDVFQAMAGGSLPVEQAIAPSTYPVATEALDGAIWGFSRQETDDLMARLQAACVRLAEYCEGQICMGVKSGLMEAFVIDADTRAAILKRNAKAVEIIKPFLNGRDVRRYHVDPKGLYLIYTHHGVRIRDFPAVEKHLARLQSQVGGTGRRSRRGTNFNSRSIISPVSWTARRSSSPTSLQPPASPWTKLDSTAEIRPISSASGPVLIGVAEFAIGVLLLCELRRAGREEGNVPAILWPVLGEFSGPAARPLQVGRQGRPSPTGVAGRSHVGVAEATCRGEVGSQRTVIQRQIDATDADIDRLVYDLYGSDRRRDCRRGKRAVRIHDGGVAGGHSFAVSPGRTVRARGLPGQSGEPGRLSPGLESAIHQSLV